MAPRPFAMSSCHVGGDAGPNLNLTSQGSPAQYQIGISSKL